AVFDVDLVEAGRTRPADLLRAKVLYTLVGGRIVHEAAGGQIRALTRTRGFPEPDPSTARGAHD
ncbi:MAG TPA: hypothetical protein VLI67_03235, partial [Vicinamibacteria bacterium]|nr:hypothetical protein [Vicinamibacteria bacterium]